MRRPRFRKLKQGKAPKEIQEVPHIPPYVLAGRMDRFKAAVVDMFMLLMPIMYGVFYLVFGSREAFAQEKLLGWAFIVIPFVLLQAILWSKKGQTPGMKAYDLKLVRTKEGAPASFVQALLRGIGVWLSILSIIGVILFWVRKHGITFQDILSGTVIVRA